MPLNAATYAEELAMKAGKPHSGMKGRNGRPRRGWKGFYGSVHDIVRPYCSLGLPTGGKRKGEQYDGAERGIPELVCRRNK
jgi:hypothetical protein